MFPKHSLNPPRTLQHVPTTHLIWRTKVRSLGASLCALIPNLRPTSKPPPSSVLYHDLITRNTTIPTSISQSLGASPTPLEDLAPSSAIPVSLDDQVPLDWDLSLCFEPESDSEFLVDTDIESAHLEDCTIDAKTAAFTTAPTGEEHNELLQDLTLPTIPAIPTPSERVVIPKLRQHPFKSSITSTASNEHVLKPTPVISRCQHVFNRDPAISGYNILNSFSKPFKRDVPNPHVSPSTRGISGLFSELLEALSMCRQSLEDLPAIGLTEITSNPPSTIPKDRDLDALIGSLKDLLACLKREDGQDPVNRMPVMASISLDDRVTHSTSTAHENRSVLHVESAVALSNVLEVLSRPFNDFATPLRISEALEDEEFISLKPESLVHVPEPSYCSDDSSGVPSAALKAQAAHIKSLPSAVDDPSGDAEISSAPSLSLIPPSSVHDSSSSPGPISSHPLPASPLASVLSRPVIPWLFVPILRGSPVCLWKISDISSQTSRFLRPLLAFTSRIPGGNMTTLATQSMLRTPPFNPRAGPHPRQSNTQELVRGISRTFRASDDLHRRLPHPLPRLLPPSRLLLAPPFSRAMPRSFVRSPLPFLSHF